MASSAPRTLVDKLWDAHVVTPLDGGRDLIYVDLHLIHEVTTPQAFEGLRLAGRSVRRPDLTVGTLDHNISTGPRNLPLTDALAIAMLQALKTNCATHGITLHDLDSPAQGIVHVIGPELGLTQPGKTIVCGDSHTTTHGAFGALAFGIGTSEVEHVLATQCLALSRPKSMRVTVTGTRAPGVGAKDLALAVVGALTCAGGTGYTIEFAGEAVRALSMEERMTLCNMSIEAGARSSLVAVDDTTIQYLEGRPQAPRGDAWTAAVARWRDCVSDPGAVFDREVTLDAAAVAPLVTWGTRPDMVAAITAQVPDPAAQASPAARASHEQALAYMGLTAGTPIDQIPVDRVFIGSCTNARLEDLRDAARVARGHHVAPSVRALVVPGSQPVKRAAEAEGLHEILMAAGFEWREPGCSMCLGMNDDVLEPGQRCASTSNRNFEGRQGRGGRTHLVSPAMAAAAAIRGHFADIRDWHYR